MISEKLSTDSRRMLQNGVPQFVGFCRCTPCRQRRGKGISVCEIIMVERCTPCRQRRGKGSRFYALGLFLRCTPCRQRRGKDKRYSDLRIASRMHPVQAAPRQRTCSTRARARAYRCTPCRQRRGKARCLQLVAGQLRMHPVQAAPRQRHPPWAAGSGTRDAPRAGSAQRNNNVPPDGSLTTGRHFFTFHPSRIPTVAPSSSVTMYNPAPHLLDRSSMAKQNLSHRANVIYDRSSPRISPAAVV